VIEHSYIHVAGPAGAGKTTFIEAMLRGTDADILAARCVRDDTLRESRESAPKVDHELRRYGAAGASGVARYVFPGRDIGSDAFFMTDLMADYSEAVVLEGDNPLNLTDLAVFVAPPLAAGRRLFVRRKRDRAKEERAKADAMEHLLREPDGVARFLGQMTGAPSAAFARQNPKLLEEARATLLAGIAQLRKAPPPKPTEHWAIARSYVGIERAQLVVVNARGERDRARGELVVRDLMRIREDDALFEDILGIRGTRVPITAVVADLSEPRDRGLRKALARVRRAIKRRRRESRP
jgi:hypothetical protein